MLTGWKVWALCALGAASEAFVVGPLLRTCGSDTASAATARISVTGRNGHGAGMTRITPTRDAATIMQESSGAGQSQTVMPPSSETVEMDEISGKRLYVEFAAFGFFNRTCQLELSANGDSIISKGMVTPEKGAWRVEEEEGLEYLQFSCPLTELYSEIFDIPSSLLFWRVPLRKATDGGIVLEGGQIISERKELFGLRTTFIDEGKFTARVLGDGEAFPVVENVDISDIKVPDGLTARKKKTKADTELAEQVAQPPLPSDLEA